MNAQRPLTAAAMQAAFARRDRSADGRFVCAVKSTGIYCRPSCPARRPRPENVIFFADAEAARAAGFRPCKRCLPDAVARDRRAVAEALRVLKHARTAPPLAELARHVGYSPSHLQKLFTAQVGLSPAAYARGLRAERASERLSAGRGVTEAIYAAGYESPSRFYEAMTGRLGMAPSAWAKGGEGVTIRWAEVETTLGTMLVAATDKGVCRLAFDTPPADLARQFPKAELQEGGTDFAQLLERVVAAVEAPGQGHDIPLDVRGTAFQERVWAELRRIPPGETRSYAQIAAAAGHPKATRAAGSANGANHVAVLIPCHRVVRANGSLGGYAFGPEIKEELLKRERQSG